jgi:heptaprenyl diphosphate synthase
MYLPVSYEIAERSMGSTRRMVWLSLLLCLGLVIYVVEATYLGTAPVPGAKLGLTNLVTLLILFYFGWKESFANVILRTLLGSLITGTFMTPAFFFSLTGALVSCAVMVLVFYILYGRFSLVGVSLSGATFHNFAQLVLAAFLVKQAAVFLQFPLLLLFAIVAGTFNGIVANLLVARLGVTR